MSGEVISVVSLEERYIIMVTSKSSDGVSFIIPSAVYKYLLQKCFSFRTLTWQYLVVH